MPQPLTEIERDVYQYLLDFLSEHTYQPSVREIGHRFGIKSTKTVSQVLHAIAAKGWIELDPARSRGVKLLGVTCILQRQTAGPAMTADPAVLAKERVG